MPNETKRRPRATWTALAKASEIRQILAPLRQDGATVLEDTDAGTVYVSMAGAVILRAMQKGGRREPWIVTYIGPRWRSNSPTCCAPDCDRPTQGDVLCHQVRGALALCPDCYTAAQAIRGGALDPSTAQA